MLVSTVSVSDYIKERKVEREKRRDDSVVATGMIYMVLLHFHLGVGLCLYVILNWVSRELEGPCRLLPSRGEHLERAHASWPALVSNNGNAPRFPHGFHLDTPTMIGVDHRC